MLWIATRTMAEAMRRMKAGSTGLRSSIIPVCFDKSFRRPSDAVRICLFRNSFSSSSVTYCLTSLSLKGLRDDVGLAEIKIYLSEQLDKRFRKAAMDTFGYGRGSISKAAGEAVLEWCRRHEKIDSLPSLAPSKGEARSPDSLSLSREASVQGSKAGAPGSECVV